MFNCSLFEVYNIYCPSFSPAGVLLNGSFISYVFDTLCSNLQIRNIKLIPNSSDSASKPLVLGDMATDTEHFKEPFLVHIHSGKVFLFFTWINLLAST